jgi:uncharacterized ferritin-like protein (DUF455 family)
MSAAQTPTATVDPTGSVEAWAFAYITSTDLGYKRCPPPVPATWSVEHHELEIPSRPGRPKELVVVPKVARSGHGTKSDEARARTIHTFLHHELQAAELMAWALLRFADSELAFRRGLLRICQDEIRHLGLYAALLEGRGVTWGAYPVRDWFWQRVPTCETPLQFVSLMGLGVEAANLEHASRFADDFEAHGDVEAAALQRLVERDEVSHVAFGRHWFEVWHGTLAFETWRAQLPKPLSPLLMRGLPLNRGARGAAGLNEAFLDALAAWSPDDDVPRA